MQKYIARRLLIAIPTLFLVGFIVFSMIRLIPGDVIIARLGEEGLLSGVAEEEIREELGLNRPFFVQYGVWMGGVFRGDMGESLWFGNPVSTEIARALPVTAELAIFAVIIGLLIAIPIGVLSAARQDSFVDYAGRLFAIIGLSVPNFWLSTLVILYAALWFQWLPPLVYQSPFDNLGGNLTQYAIPSLILGFSLCATIMRMTRSSMLEVLRQDYIRTARAKGLRERAVIARHALKNASIPILTIVGNQFGNLLGGTIIIETIFGLPGLGSITLEAIDHRDYPMIQSVVLLGAGFLILTNLLVDLTYAWLDPRIRYA